MAQKNLSLLSAYNALHKFDVICISETYLHKSADNDALSTDNIIRALTTYLTRREVVYVFILKSC